MAPLEMLDVAAGTDREKEVVSYSRGHLRFYSITSQSLLLQADAGSGMKILQLCNHIVLNSHLQNAEPRLLVLDASGGRRHALNRL